MRLCYEDVTNNNIDYVQTHAEFLRDKFNEDDLHKQFVDSIISVVGEAEPQEAQVFVL